MADSTYLHKALILLLLSSALQTVAASGDGGSGSLYVLYLGNDYYQDEEGKWIDANWWIIDALNDSNPFIVRFMAPAGDGYKSRDLRFADYDVVIFSEVWRSHFNDSQLSDLEVHVKGGGGFIMFGGWGAWGDSMNTGNGTTRSWSGSCPSRSYQMRMR